MNYRGIAFWLLVIAGSIFAMAGIVGMVSAAWVDVTPTQVPIFVNSTGANLTELRNHAYPIHYLQQGETVYLGDHLDISGSLQGNQALAWWPAGYPNVDEQPYVMPMPDSNAGYYDFYIDPGTFSNHLGMWYKWNGYMESNGNTEAFFVSAQYRNSTLTYSNGTVINQSEIIPGNYTEPKLPKEPLLPIRHVADYLIMRGDSLNITTDANESAVWIFNSNDNSIVYSHGNAGEIVVGGDQIRNLQPGRYNILVQTLGEQSLNLDVQYEGNNTLRWFDRSQFVVHTVDLTGKTPDAAIQLLSSIFPQTYDEYKEYTLIVQSPDISIVSMDQVAIGSAKEYYLMDDKRGNVSLMDVRGYTNALPGTPITVTLDEASTNPREILSATYNTVAQGTFLGDSRYYQVYVPLYWDSLSVGQHTLTARTSGGGIVHADFPVTVMPPDSYQPNISVKWVGEENPWKPNMTTPTPVVVTQIVTQIVTVRVTPPEEEVFAAQEKVSEERDRFYWFWGIASVVAIAGLYLIGRFIYRANKRKRWMRK